MKVVYIYRSIEMGFSIDNVFRPIENKMKDFCSVDSITFENTNYTWKSMLKNIIQVKSYLKKNPDVIIHITGTENYLLPFLSKYKTVVTVHDFGFFTAHKKTLRLLIKYPLWIASIKFADIVTFISEKSREEALELVKIDLKKTDIVMNPVNSNYYPLEDYKFNENCPKILMVGTKENKNIVRTIKALAGINCELRIIGPLLLSQKELLKEYKINYTQVQNISNEQIIKEYQMCDIVTFASEHEGFGMPIIEGQAAGKTVVTSNISPMKDIANGSCPLVDPFNVKSIREGIIEAIVNHDKYEELGKKNIKLYSVDKIAKKYFNIYCELSERK